ncbi:hypothetical protein CWI37_0184p0030 [Hamiltosporidium tvaerminnensis]|uniref:Uncharacterized protein n=1 Tax=Hamiltosporidium tvaerminnensis TaxID=1176355 RepID=A0A4Q9L8M8_9MICR|nr:hypothetical protein CWI37_0184p0030 [Hamiltosporidium tvaerminnensis]
MLKKCILFKDSKIKGLNIERIIFLNLCMSTHSMEHLLQKENSLMHKLKAAESENLDLQGALLKIKDEIKTHQQKQKILNNEYIYIVEKHKEYTIIFEELKEMVVNYKEERIKREIYKITKKYNSLLKNITGISFKPTYKIFIDFSNFTSLEEQANKNNFKELEIEMKKYKEYNKQHLLMLITENIKNFLNDLKEIHNLVFYLKFLVKYELYFKRNEMSFCIPRILFSDLKKSFYFHFLTEKSTNRLDKPEWMFTHLLKKIESYFKTLQIYTKIYFEELKDENLKNNSDLQINNLFSTEKEFTKNTLNYLICKINTLICLKVRELYKLESQQKRSLVLHFSLEFLKYQNTIEEKYNLISDIPVLLELLIKVQKEFLSQQLYNTHEKTPLGWFKEYFRILKENTLFCNSYVLLDINHLRRENKSLIRNNNSQYSIDSNSSISNFSKNEISNQSYKNDSDISIPIIFDITFQFIIDSIFVYLETFISNLRYIKRQEIHLICGFFSEIENLKNKINEEETDFLIDLEKKEGFDIKKFYIDISKLSRFNNENLKLIKSLIINDIKNILKNIKNIDACSEKNLVTFSIEMNEILKEYKKYMEHSSKYVQKIVKETIDDYLVERLTIIKFRTDEFLRFRHFFGQLKESFEEKEWTTNIACKILEDIFEGRETKYQNDLFIKIKENYDF